MDALRGEWEAEADGVVLIPVDGTLLAAGLREAPSTLAVAVVGPELKGAETVLLFCGVGTEPDTRPIAEALWAAGKQVLFPKCLPHRRMEARAVRGMEELVPGVFGIPEPGGDCPAVERGKIDMVLVPAVCYDRSRFRLGQGGGYYDRYLSGYGGATVGLCRDALLLERVPRERHDLPVERVLTESLCL